MFCLIPLGEEHQGHGHCDCYEKIRRSSSYGIERDDNLREGTREGGGNSAGNEDNGWNDSAGDEDKGGGNSACGEDKCGKEGREVHW
jgi:hypothetical protein